MKKEELIRHTIDGTTVQECPTYGELNKKIWKVLRAQQPPLTKCDDVEKFRLVGNFAGGLGVTQAGGFWVANTTRNTGAACSAGAVKGLLTDEEKLNKEYAIKGMEAAGNAALAPLIDALKAELEAHENALRAQEEREVKAMRRELVSWFSALSLAEQTKIYEARA